MEVCGGHHGTNRDALGVHRYERHAPMTPEGLVDETTGIRQFVVGTGGEPGGSVIDPNQVPKGVLGPVVLDFGVIKVDLDAGSYSWAFIAVDGTVMDSGTDQCHGVPGSTGTTPPTVTNVAPGNGGEDVPIGSKVEATFSKAMDPSTISDMNGASTTFTLTKPDGTDADTNPDAVSGTVAYDSTSKKATLTPSPNPLDSSTTYTATVKGGANGVKDAAGNPLSADEVWTFTTAPAAPSNLTAARSGPLGKQRIDLTWTDNSSYEAGFVVERSTTSSFTTNLVTSQQLAANITSYIDSSLQNKTTYYYRVFAVDLAGRRSAPSNVASATTK
jgi:hypothetical protein